MGNQRHADTTPHGYRGSAAKALVIAAICLIGGLTFTGLPIFETSLWIAYAVMVMVEIALAVVLFFSRWTNKPQQSSSYYWHCFKPDRATSTSRCDTPQLIRSSRSTTRSLVLCALAVYLIKKASPGLFDPTPDGVPAHLGCSPLLGRAAPIRPIRHPMAHTLSAL
ncbi:hypothetical protein GS415_02435 [Rhodococcus hoagii]|nr:hypothetical protein [Prescottella equi]